MGVFDLMVDVLNEVSPTVQMIVPSDMLSFFIRMPNTIFKDQPSSPCSLSVSEGSCSTTSQKEVDFL